MLKGNDVRIVKLKAAMWEARNEERLISKAIRAYEDPAFEQQPKEDLELYIDEQKVIVKNVPHIIRNQEVFENLQLTSTLEEVLKEEYQNSIPSEINFEDLLK